MRISEAGIRSSLPTTRFAVPAGHRRERQLGLRRTARGQVPVRPPKGRQVPILTAIRRAARSLAYVRHATAPVSHGDVPATLRMRRPATIRWSQPNGSATGRPRPRSAAPWRG